MTGARGARVVVLALAVALASAAGAQGAPALSAGPAPSALPAPVAVEPRLAFTDGGTALVRARVGHGYGGVLPLGESAPGPVVPSPSPSGSPSPFPSGSPSPSPSATTPAPSPTGTSTALPAPTPAPTASPSPPVPDPADSQPSGAFADEVRYLAFVRHRPDVGPHHGGDVHVLVSRQGSPERVVRVTCDAARESHPVVSPETGRVAWATDAGGSWDVAVTTRSVEELGDACTQDETRRVTSGDADELWPAFVPSSDLVVYSGTRDDPAGLGDLWMQGVDAAESTATRLTQSEHAETQPSVSPLVARSGESYVLVAFSTTEFRRDGSVALLRLTGDPHGDGPFRPVPDRSRLVNPYQSDPEHWWDTTPQGSEPAFGGPTSTTWGGEGFVLASTTTSDDPAGDVAVAMVGTQGDADPAVEQQVRVVGDVGRPETHPTWTSGLSPFGEWYDAADLVAEVPAPPSVVSDVRADDGSGRRSTTPARPGCGTPDDIDVPPGDAMPSYSPAGDRLVVATRTVTCELDDGEWVGSQGWALHVVDTTDLTSVPLEYDREPTDVDVSPRWSPDGRRIVLERYRDDGEEVERGLVLVDVASGTTGPRPTRELELPEPEEWEYEVGVRDASWSPDATRLVVSRTVATSAARVAVPDSYAGTTSLWVVDVDAPATARELVARVDCGSTTCGPQEYVVRGRSPAWSPDGTRIAVASLALVRRSGDVHVVDNPGAVSVLTLQDPAAGVVTDVRAVTGFHADGTPTASRPLVAASDEPAWSPDGSVLAVTAVPAGRSHELGVWLVAPDGSGARPVADGRGLETDPVLQPWTDLVLTMTATPLTADGPTAVVARATNAGPGPVERGAVSIALPPGAAAAVPPACGLSAGVVRCPLVRLRPGESRDVALTVTGDDGATPFLAVATTTTPERVVTNNTARASTGVDGGVGVTVELDRSPVYVGGAPATATFTVRNAGTRPASDVRLAPALPAAVVASGPPECPVPADPCALGTLPGRGARVLRVTLTPGPAFVGPPAVGAVTGTVSTSSPDPDRSDDVASVDLEVRSPQLSVLPPVTRPGGVVFVAGQWFPPSVDVRLSWSQGVMGSPGPHTTDAEGRFGTALLVIADTLVAPRDLRADDTATPGGFGQVAAPVLIVPPSVAAPSFLFRK
ncbi:putative FHA domain containing protein [Cellulomonas flavigena DSM 20109]|uniref:Putative FHA domain containing protein n=1 Tax=Cellulomonas flavigena (strain ATCC 482 / DSM 20109 / BCRC 11376 / JCM 18109 / NBRC 3775 / NCIMB 8073 / NRS 134) TaxID=446466 RepID=D5UGP9_CELFN|nr:PD40 domain-containing protein [Cellulomonas flavigena]ADG75147.1 putative FHA domain containing protein [Cellulomonas flavigena DSM 20109]